MNLSERITVNPEICNGKPTIRGKRITVKTIIEYIAAGETIANILKAHPSLVEEDIKAALDFAAHVMDNGIKTIKVK